jgi:trehalose synthase
MRTVPVWPRSIDEYRSVVSNDIVNGLHRRAWELTGSRILHLNSTAFGGGVAELLLAQIPLLEDLGLGAHWSVIDGDEEFFGITKGIHNGFQGNHDVKWTPEIAEHYLSVQQHNAELMTGEWDVVVVHDPQPLAIPFLLGERRREIAKRWIWRCHIDCADPHPEIWAFVRQYLEAYDAVVFTMKEFVQPDIPVERVMISPPSIDPMSPKNAPLAPITVTDVCRQYGLDPRRPVIAQISRFDAWKDPMGVIDVYHIVKQEFPEVQLILAGSLAHDDPEGFEFYESALRSRGDDHDLFILSNFQEVGNTAVNCFQRAALVVIQKSIKEGFGLTVSEAAWKGRPVVGGNTGGITLQIDDRETGYLVDSVEECADRVLDLLGDRQQAERMGEGARELVRSRFLTTRELADWLDLWIDLARG